MFNVTVDYFLSSVGGDGLQSVKSFCSVQIFFFFEKLLLCFEVVLDDKTCVRLFCNAAVIYRL